MCKISTKIIKLYGSRSSILQTNLRGFPKILEHCLNIWDFALLNKYYQITKKSVDVSQFYINHLNHLNVWLASNQGPLVLKLRTLPLSHSELWSGHKPFLPFCVSSWRKFEDYVYYKTIISENVLFEAQVKIFFYIVEKLCSVLKIFNFLYF